MKTLARSAYDMTLADWTAWMAAQGAPAYRARQLFHALYQRGVASLEAITDWPKGLRQAVAAEFALGTLAPTESQQSSDGTRKWLSKLADGQFVETVLIPTDARHTVCVSTQVGCAYTCAFCASGQAGFRRNLTAGEIVQEILLVQRAVAPRRVTNVVFMGMGEPLANYDSVLTAIRVFNEPEGFKIGARKMTISTVGLVPMIERLGKEGLQVELSVSLHAPNDAVRGRLMPVNTKYPVAQLIAACRAYAEATKRLITFEYILIDKINDQPAHAVQLAELVKGLLCKVNLIPCHPVSGTPWGRPPVERMLGFERTLRHRGVPCTLRRSRGLDIDGACGQLRLRRVDAAPPPSGSRLRRIDAAPAQPV